MKYFTPVCSLTFALTLVACGEDAEESTLGGSAHGPGGGGSTGTGGSGEPVLGGGVVAGSGNGNLAPGDMMDGSACGGTSLEASQSPINLLVVIDRSGSMDATPDGFDVNKWTALRLGLDGALDATQDRLIVGLELYPHDPDNEVPAQCTPDVCCTMPDTVEDAIVVPLAPGVSAFPDITAALDNVGPGGGTPTARALELALEYFEGADGQALTGKKYVLLATDGGPNCNADTSCDAENCTANIDFGVPPADGNECAPEVRGPIFCIDDAATIAAAEALANAGVQTIVVGIPGTEAYTDVLNAVAIAGGAPNTAGDTDYYAVTTGGGVSGLEMTLVDITTGLIRTCELSLEEAPPDRTLVNVEIDGEFIPFLNTSGSADAGAGAVAADAGPDAAVAPPPVVTNPDGWVFDDTTSPPTIVLQGAPCDEMLANGAENVEIVFGCPRVEVDIR